MPGAAGSDEPLVRVRDLSVTYADGTCGRRALDGITFDLHRGQVVGIIGDSGSGKTTLGLSLVRLLPPGGRIDGGSIHFRRTDLLKLSEREIERIRGAEVAMIFQEPELALNPFLTAQRQVEEVIAAHHSWSRAERRTHARRILKDAQLPDEALHAAYPDQLSGGERQRVATATALACRPALVIADEPTTSLDLLLQARWLALMKELRAEMGMALLLITHDPAILAGWADRLIVMYAGTIVEEGHFEEVIRRPLHPYTCALLGSVPPAGGETASKRQRLPEIIGGAGQKSSGQGCPYELRCQERQPLCSRRTPIDIVQGGRRVRCFKYGE